MSVNKIEVYGARVNNLKNIDVEIPRNALTVITGLSGSGKSSLAFDTIYAEGQRRYIETFSAYARNFLGNLQRPDVDKISGLSPVISIEQKTTNKNPRSTVGTVTEIYDYLRLLYARTATPYSYLTGQPMQKYTEEQVADHIINDYQERRILLLASLIRQRKGHYRELFESLRRKGFLQVRVDGEIQEIARGMKTDRFKNHDIEVVIDKLQIDTQSTDEQRIRRSIKTALDQGQGVMMVLDKESGQTRIFSKHLIDPDTGLSYNEPAPNLFSFNSPQGACPHCKGLGIVSQLDIEKIIPDPHLSIRDGAIQPLGKQKNQMIFWQIDSILQQHQLDISTPVENIPHDVLDEILYGTLQPVRIDKTLVHTSSDYFTHYDGILKYLHSLLADGDTAAAQKWALQYTADVVCPECHGQRLCKEALAYRIGDNNIAQTSHLEITELHEWAKKLELTGGDESALMVNSQYKEVAAEIAKEIATRTSFLLEVGLGYLSLDRPSATLSGGESQRIRLATQIGSQLVNVLYILDEPSIGLHQRDNERLIHSLKHLRDIGNTVVVVEHDKDMMLAADWIIDIGPKAGLHGGEVVFMGTPQQMLQSDTNTLTAQYLKGEKALEIPSLRAPARKKEKHDVIKITGARGNNLKNISVEFPLGKLIVVTGVSGSGKSTLVNETLLPIISHQLYRSNKQPLPYDSIEGIDLINKVVSVDQSPIGRTPRSNPATYTGVFSDIRALFVNLPEAKIRGYKPGRFSFNVKGGRCETCQGNGYKTIEMNFLPDVTVPCESCHGKRYNRETLEVRYKGKSIADVLDMTITQATEFFQSIPSISRKIKTLQDVGLGYIKLGQPSTTLSGGENQRVKLAAELAKKDTGRTLYILDEPTTGLHFEDIRILMGVLRQLSDKGSTIIIIEHNLDVILAADWIIDIGPEGGSKGGNVIATGTPWELAKNPTKGHTAYYIAQELKQQKNSTKAKK